MLRYDAADHAFLLRSQKRGIKIRLEAKLLYHLEYLFLALGGHLSPIVQNPVNSSFRNSGSLRYIIDSHLIPFHTLMHKHQYPYLFEPQISEK